MKYGFSRFYDRLWQKNMNSPHISYFNSNNLNKLIILILVYIAFIIKKDPFNDIKVTFK